MSIATAAQMSPAGSVGEPLFEDHEVVLRIQNAGDNKRFDSYSLESRYAAATDAFRFTVGGDIVNQYSLDILKAGTSVQLVIDGNIQFSGLIDKSPVKISRSGKFIEISGRDMGSVLVDSCIDPFSYEFDENATLEQALTKIVSPYGFKVATTDNGSRNIQTGTSITSNDPPVYIKDFSIKACRPSPGEGAFQYASRLAKRFGLWLKADALGKTIIAGRPNYSQPPLYTLSLSENASIFDYAIDFNLTNQTDVIVMQGSGGNGNFQKSSFKVAVVNEFNGYNPDGTYTDNVKATLAKYPGIPVLDMKPQLLKFQDRFESSIHRPTYIVNDEAKTIEQLQFAARQKMSQLQMEAVSISVSVLGHMQNNIPWTVNTIVKVEDNITNFNENMWISERTFTKSRSGGTITTLKLIPPYVLELNL